MNLTGKVGQGGGLSGTQIGGLNHKKVTEADGNLNHYLSNLNPIQRQQILKLNEISSNLPNQSN